MITQDVTQITPLPSFLAPERPAAVDNLVEVELPLLTEELAEVISQINSTETNINNKELSVTNKYNDMQPHFDEIDLVAAAIASGDLPTIIDDADTSALKTWSSEKIDSEIDIHSKTAKTTLADTDEFMTADSTSTFSLKKITWVNIKAALANLFIPKVVTPTTNALGKIDVNGNIVNSDIVNDSNGNTGFGDTLSAWSGLKATQLGRSAIANVGNFTQHSSNAYYDGLVYRYIANGYATRLVLDADNKVIKFENASSGVADGVITWTNVLTCDINGNLLIGATSTTANTNGFFIRDMGTLCNIGHPSGTASGSAYHLFGYNGSGIGSITQNGTTAVAYNTTSDYRLKENIRPSDCKRFMDIKFVDYERIDGRHECGVIAHELQEVYPDLVFGEKDATEIRKIELTPEIIEVKDQDGNVAIEAVGATYEEQEFPVYQQVNYMGLIARMGTVVQQQNKVIEDLKSRLEILESK